MNRGECRWGLGLLELSAHGIEPFLSKVCRDQVHFCLTFDNWSYVYDVLPWLLFAQLLTTSQKEEIVTDWVSNWRARLDKALLIELENRLVKCQMQSKDVVHKCLRLLQDEYLLIGCWELTTSSSVTNLLTISKLCMCSNCNLLSASTQHLKISNVNKGWG